MQPHLHLRAGSQSNRAASMTSCYNFSPVSCEMSGVYRCRSRHRLPECHSMSLPIGNPPGTESPRKRSRCPFLPSTWHGFPARVFQVSLPAVHLARNSRESVPGSTSCRPPATVSLRKCSRWHLPASTWHGIPAKAFQVSFPAVHLARNPRKSVPGVTSCRPPGTESPRKRSRWHLPVFHLARFSHKSVSGVLSLPPTCHGNIVPS